MNGMHLQFYTCKLRKHRGKSIYEWLLETAKAHGVPGGFALHAMAGYGRDKALREEHFFELASDTPVIVSFFSTQEVMLSFLALIKKENLQLFYTLSPVEYGIT